jgi:[ribosomal protein S18]-alanine N-acetyltransferase
VPTNPKRQVLGLPSVSTKASRDPADIRLRPYTPADFDKIYAIDQACYEPRIAYSRTEMLQYLRFPGAECVVAEASRENSPPAMIGFCLTAHKDSWGYVVTMDVLNEYRRHGAGSMLLTEAERRLVAAGVRQIGLETATDNVPAIAFWQKHGYGKSGVRKNYYPGGRDAYTMAKRL